MAKKNLTLRGRGVENDQKNLNIIYVCSLSVVSQVFVCFHCYSQVQLSPGLSIVTKGTRLTTPI